jgi:predicted tellurium resistance membrane protein TerC
MESFVAQRKTGQKISFAIGMISYLAAVAALAAVAYYGSILGSEHPIVASLAASVVFFIGTGVVLHVMGTVSLPDLRPGRPGHQGDDIT